MKVQFSLVGQLDRPADLYFDMDAIPQVNDAIDIYGGNFFVRTVVWYPQGDQEAASDDNTPFVYIVVGDRRPM